MDITFQALADPRRRAIVELLGTGERPVGELVSALDIAQSGVSRHLRVLKEAGFVSSRTHGQQRLYSLRPEPFAELAGWLAKYRQVWEQRFDAFGDTLARKLEEENQKEP